MRLERSYQKGEIELKLYAMSHSDCASRVGLAKPPKMRDMGQLSD